MKKIFLLFMLGFPLLLCAVNENSQWFECVIHDTDGYVYVRSGPAKNSTVIDTLFEGGLFYVYGDTSAAWLRVQKPYGADGYVHKSRVQYFYQLDSVTQHQIIEDAFREMIRAEKNGDRQLRNDVYEEQFIPAYGALHKLFCLKPDTTLLSLYFRTLPYVSGSADEGKDWTSAEMWLCRPAEVQQTICSLPANQQEYAINSIETGMALSGKEKLFDPAELHKRYTALEKPCQ